MTQWVLILPVVLAWAGFVAYAATAIAATPKRIRRLKRRQVWVWYDTRKGKPRRRCKRVLA